MFILWREIIALLLSNDSDLGNSFVTFLLRDKTFLWTSQLCMVGRVYFLDSLWSHFIDGEMKRSIARDLAVWRKGLLFVTLPCLLQALWPCALRSAPLASIFSFLEWS